MRTKAVAVTAAAAIIAAFALAPSALAKGKDHPAKSARKIDRTASTAAVAGGRSSTPTPSPADQSGLDAITSLLTGALTDLVVGPGNGHGKGQANGQANAKAKANANSNGNAKGKSNSNGNANGQASSGTSGGSTGQTNGNSNGNGNGNGNGLTVHVGPVTVHIGGGTPSSAAPNVTSSKAAAPDPATTAAAPSRDHGSGVTQTGAAGTSAASSSPTPRLETAPQDAPALEPQSEPAAAGTATQRAEQQEAAYPTNMNDVADGTAMLVGVLIVFMIGVISVVVSAGYRSRRADHRAR